MQKWKFDWNYWERKIDGYWPAKNTPKVEFNFNRPEWDNYFMSAAILASKRSADPATQCGCVLVDKFNRIISTGYNSYRSGLPHDKLPNCRVDENHPSTKQKNKYRWMRHAEENMILQSPVDIRTLQEPRIYVIGRLCLECSQKVEAVGITHWIMLERGDRWGAKSLEDDPYGDAQDWLWFTQQKNIRLEWMMFDNNDFNWIKEAFSI